MIATKLNEFRQILTSKRDDLARLLRNREGIVIEKSADALDEVQHATERELAIRNLDRDARLFRSVRDALRRLDDRSFGICLHCDEEISLKRLAAVPWALFCVKGQEEEDCKQCAGEEVGEEMRSGSAA